MRYWEDLNDKYAFSDGNSVPPDAYLCRTVYVQALNAVAARLKSNVRAVAFDRGGCHNPCLIVMVTVKQFKKIPAPDVTSGDFDLDSIPDEKEPTDAAWEATVAECMEMNLDDFVISEPVLSPDFTPFLVSVKAGTYVIVTDDDLDEAANALGREVSGDELRGALALYPAKSPGPFKELRKLLKKKEAEFKSKGGRGVELADEIDRIRMVLAVRK
jgi:hypothetical protein